MHNTRYIMFIYGQYIILHYTMVLNIQIQVLYIDRSHAFEKKWEMSGPVRQYTYSIIIFLFYIFICRIPAIRYILYTSCNRLLIELFIKMICVGQNLANVCNK